MSVISNTLLKKIQRIKIQTTHLANTLLAGTYKSAFKGKGMEFEEVREYVEGDDSRNIDWNVTARMNHPFVKTFREERELTVTLAVDVSFSTHFGSGERLKSDLIAEIAAVIAFSAIKNNDKVGVIFFTDKIEKFIPPKKGKSHILRIIREVLAFNPQAKGTDIAGALEYFNSVIKKRSICFILSDFMSSSFEKPLKIASKKHDLVGLRIHDKREDSLPNIGLIPMQDAETEKLIFVDTSSKKVRADFAKNRLEKVAMLKKLFPSSGVDLIDLATGTDYVKPLINFFKTRGKRR